MHVFVRDMPWALQDEGQTPVAAGDSFFVVPTNQPYIPPVRLENMLGAIEGWHADPVLPGPPGDGLWLLTELSNHRFHFEASPDVSLRVALEWHLGMPSGQLEVLPATPPIRDHARQGVAPRQLYIALPHDLLPGVPFILDQRPVLLNVVWVYAPGGRIEVAELYAPHAHRCPDTHFFKLTGGYCPPGTANQQRFVHPGQVLVVEYCRRRWGGVPSANEDARPPGDSDNESDSDDPRENPADDTGAVTGDYDNAEIATAVGDAGTGSTHREGGRRAAPATTTR